jgi:hypothetical protein
MTISRVALFSIIVVLSTSSLGAQNERTVGNVLRNVRRVEIPLTGYPVERTVAEAFRHTLAPDAAVVEVREGQAVRTGSLRIHVVGTPADTTAGGFFFRLLPDGTGELRASHAHLLYTAFCRIQEEWSTDDVRNYAQGRTLRMRVPWLEGNDGMFALFPRIVRDYDPASAIKELARLGCSHVSVNVLASAASAEQTVPGEIYSRFYTVSPDIDQFVETDLTRGLYPAEYLAANLALLKNNAALAVAYGLTPGLTVCSPRTMPEAFFTKYPYLRGARVDHPFRSYRPRYTATLSHPLIRWHYAQLMRAVIKEVPELGYLYLWTNDSGSGFEYVSTLYAGRNGGAYLIREWKSDSSIARAAGENVVRYLRLLRDAASEFRPDFHVITALNWFGAEKDIVLDGLDKRLDLYVSAADTTDTRRWPRIRALGAKGSTLLGTARTGANYVLGVPCPWLSYDRLLAAVSPGLNHLSVTFDPPSHSRWDINREIIRAYQSGTLETVDQTVASTARRWCGAEAAPALTQAWRLADRAVRSFPDVPLYGNSWAFPWYRHWVRPFVPDISRIPVKERAYYEQHLIATFNNPTLIDFSADALWLLIDIQQAASIVRQCDSLVWTPLDTAIVLLDRSLTSRSLDSTAGEVLRDQRDRLAALRCYFRTLRNIAGWIAGVKGYMAATSAEAQSMMLRAVRSTIDDETHNTEELSRLFGGTDTRFMPMAAVGENWAFYGANFGTLLQKKIALMKKHRGDIPFMDPDFMWRTGPECPVPAAEYLRYR